MKVSTLMVYFDKENNPILRKSFVVVADILGYSNFIIKSFNDGTQNDALGKVFEAVIKAGKNIKDPSKLKWYTKIYSDNLIICYPILQGKGNFEFGQACYNICHFQLDMAERGFFLRGGIAFGEIHISENLIFGYPLNEVKKADKPGNPPGIILLNSAKELMRNLPDSNNNQIINNILCKDKDNFFINYLYPLDAFQDEGRIIALKKHKSFIELNISKHRLSDKRISAKYYWLADYHNNFCRQSKHFNSNEFFIKY